MPRYTYPTDLSDAEFACLVPLLPPPKRRGRPRKRPVRETVDAIFYLVRTGCQWRTRPGKTAGNAGAVAGKAPNGVRCSSATASSPHSVTPSTSSR